MTRSHLRRKCALTAVFALAAPLLGLQPAATAAGLPEIHAASAAVPGTTALAAPTGVQAGAALAAADDAVGCGYGDGGQYSSTICWLDMTEYDDTIARTPDGQDMSVVLPGDYRLSYTIRTTEVSGFTAPGVEARSVPIEPRFAFGTEAYREIPGEPSLYSLPPGAGRTTGLDVTLSDIQVEDRRGNPLTSFSFVATDTEDNISGESLRWTSDKALDLLEVLYDRGSKGCKPANMTGFGTTTVTCAGVGGASTLGEKSTSVLVSADAPTTFSLRWQTRARSGIAFGINTASVEVAKQVDGRAQAADSFDVSVRSPEGSVLGTASTGSATEATTGPVVVIPPNNDEPFTLSDTATPGSGTDLADYTATWACTRNGAADPSLPSGEHRSVEVRPGIGDAISCTVTNSALPVPAEPPLVTCATDSALFNTAYGDGGVLPAGQRDSNWQAGVGDATGPASVDGWIPAWVVDGPSAWLASPFDNAAWISYYPNTRQRVENEDVYFRYRFRIDPGVPLDGFALPMDFYADNSVPEVWVNDVAQSPTQTGLPQSPTNPYQHRGFERGAQAATVLTRGFRHGANEIVVRVASGAPNVGFMAQMHPDQLCNDWGDAPEGFGTSAAGNGPRHGITDYDSTRHRTSLMIGAAVDAEADGRPGPIAQGDDDDGFDDEDGVPELELRPGDVAASAEVRVVNETGAPATLHGWIDTNDNGAFEPLESAAAAVPPGAPAVVLAWAGLPPAAEGTRPVIRLRLTSGPLLDDPATTVDERSLGVAPDGEVEDGRAWVGTPVPTTCQQPFVETFGTGSGYGPPLPAGQTTYGHTGSGYVHDGNYAVLPRLDGTAGNWWHVGDDHTVGDENGRMMVVNASLEPGVFFKRTFTGLTVGNRYDFSAWLTNANAAGSPILPNVTFRIVDPDTGAVLASSDTGDIPPTASLTWKRYGTGFTAVQASVRLEIVNNARGGSGNDLALDDISLATACDFGDAPDRYGTTLSAGGPVHRISPGLFLGSSPDVEPDGQPGPAADGDDVAGAADEDGISTPIVVTTGRETRVQVRATNTTETDATLAGWIDLDGDGRFEPGERRLATVLAGSGTDQYALDFPAGTTTADSYARFRLLAGDPAPLGPADRGEVEDHAVDVRTPELSVTKSSRVIGDPRPGARVEYTVRIESTGTGDFTDTHPAVVLDDLTDVLDDATYRHDAVANTGTTSYDGHRIRWSGALPSGSTVTLTYSVTLTGGGDGTVRNVAFAATEPDPETPDCDDPATTQACATEIVELPKSTIAKQVTPGMAGQLGQPVTFTITMHNAGPGDYTADHPATFTDDLSGVLDDATLDQSTLQVSAGTVELSDESLVWRGVLTAGDSATVRYTVTYTGGGDHLVDNLACLPGAEVATGAEQCSRAVVAGSGLQQSKTVNPSSGTAVSADQTLTYTLRFENVGEAPATVDTVDDVSDVLDDAELLGSPDADAGLAAALVGETIRITGVVQPQETLTVRYRVRVKPYAEQSDEHVLDNVLACPPGSPADCLPEVTSNPVRHLVVDKRSTTLGTPDTGDRMSYLITVVNDGGAGYSGTDPAVVLDDLTDVLDDATYNGDARALSGDTAGSVGDLTVAGGRLRWSGPLAPGETVYIAYSVTVTNQGDHRLANGVTITGCPEAECTSGPVVTPLPHVVAAKSAGPASGAPLQPGDEVRYTLRWANDGTAPGPVDSTDDLSDVLDDAELLDGPRSSRAGVTAELVGTEVRVTGSLPVGGSVEVTYRVRIKPSEQHGNNVLRNSVLQDTPQVDCVEQRCSPVAPPSTAHAVGDLHDRKEVDPDGGTVTPGQRVTYTLYFENGGTAPVVVNRLDDLADVLDDATLTAPPRSTSAAVTVSAVRDGRLRIGGVLAPGRSAEVRYTVTVGAGGGNGYLVNHLLAPGAPVPDGCATGRGLAAMDCTVNQVRAPEASSAGSPNGPLPETGSPLSSWLAPTGLFILVAGLLLLAIGRRRELCIR